MIETVSPAPAEQPRCFVGRPSGCLVSDSQAADVDTRSFSISEHGGS